LRHAKIGLLSQLTADALHPTAISEIVVIGSASLTAAFRITGTQLQVPDLFGMERRAHPGIVLTFGKHAR
jgi:hypothetical protein